MNENLPVHVNEIQTDGIITYANEVIAIIAGMAVNEVDGVASMINTSAIADLFTRGKPITRGVKVEVGVEEVSVDLVLTVEYGKPIQKVCVEVQESVRKAIETMTGLHLVRVDVHVMGVSFERETKEIAQGYVKATTAQKSIEETKTPKMPFTRVAPEASPVKDDVKDEEELDDDLLDDVFDEADDEISDETDEPESLNPFGGEPPVTEDEDAEDSLEEWPE